MTNTHYIPKLSEFHNGFEYEFNGMSLTSLTIIDLSKEGLESNEDIAVNPIKLWEKNTLNLSGPWNRGYKDIEEGIKNNKVRVKYLDREDAESLGWVFKTGHKLTEWYKGQEDWFCERLPGDTPHKFWEHELLIHPTDHTIQIKCKTDSGDWETFFEGYCKNKSELAKLMQMINIGQNHDGYVPRG